MVTHIKRDGRLLCTNHLTPKERNFNMKVFSHFGKRAVNTISFSEAVNAHPEYAKKYWCRFCTLKFYEILNRQKQPIQK